MKWKLKKDSERTDEELKQQKKVYDLAGIFSSIAAFVVLIICILPDSIFLFILGLSVAAFLIGNAALWFNCSSDNKFELRLREALREHERKSL